MNNQKEPNELWKDLADDITEYEFQAGLFASTMAAARRRQKVRRRVIASSILIPVFAVSFIFLWAVQENFPAKPPDKISQSSAPEQERSTIAQPEGQSTNIPGTSIEVISDEELFALFKGRSIGLVGETGRQQLVFLGD